MSIGVDVNSLGYDVMPDRYYVYADGRAIDSFTGKEMPKTIRHGYVCVAIYNPATKKTRQEYLHRIIGKAFVYNPNNLPCINHINGNKKDNSVGNLEWCSKGYNVLHAYATGLRKNGHGGGKNAPIMCVETNRKFRSIAEGARVIGVSYSALCNCLCGKTKTCAKAHWKYLQ